MDFVSICCGFGSLDAELTIILSGGSSGHFAKLVPYLADSYRVYAIDLLGFGASDKPHDAEYGPELWAELLCGIFLQQYVHCTIYYFRKNDWN